MTEINQLSDKELSEALNFHRRQRNLSRGVNESHHMRQTQMVRILEAEEARRLDELSKDTLKSYATKKANQIIDKDEKSNPSGVHGGGSSKERNKDFDKLNLARKKMKEEVELNEATFSMDIDGNYKKKVALSALNAGLKINFKQHGGATEMILMGDKDKITKFLKARKVPSAEIDNGFVKEEADLEEADLRITKVYNKFPKKATYAVHSPDRKYYKEFDSMEKAKAHHAEKTGK